MRIQAHSLIVRKQNAFETNEVEKNIFIFLMFYTEKKQKLSGTLSILVFQIKLCDWYLCRRFRESQSMRTYIQMTLNWNIIVASLLLNQTTQFTVFDNILQYIIVDQFKSFMSGLLKLDICPPPPYTSNQSSKFFISFI